MIAAAKKARCHDFIIALPNGYDTVVGEGGGSLSGGEKQRISIAQAISELTRGKTIITIAHRLATIQNADQILVVEDGRIVQQGTPAQLAGEEGLSRRFLAIRRQAEGWRITAE